MKHILAISKVKVEETTKNEIVPRPVHNLNRQDRMLLVLCNITSHIL